MGDEGDSPNSHHPKPPIFNRSLSSPSTMTKTQIPSVANNNNNNKKHSDVGAEHKRTEPDSLKVPETNPHQTSETPDSAEDIMSSSRAAIESETAANQSDGCIVS